MNQVSKLLGKDPSTISRYEAGAVEITTEILEKLLEIYAISVAEVFIRVNERKDDNNGI